MADGGDGHRKHFGLGVFMPVANNGWIISRTSPQHQQTYRLNKGIAQLAEEIDFDYVFSMAKWSGANGRPHDRLRQGCPGLL